MKRAAALAALLLAAGCATSPLGGQSAEPKWTPLFDGETLQGWTPKIRGYALGENFNDTFRAEDGVIRVSYDRYADRFEDRFGHLFYQSPFAAFRLRLEYRFVGKYLSDTADWAKSNSGIMVLAQDPATMAVGQEFPVSIEAQFLGSDRPWGDRTGNLCTPGTNVVMKGKLVTDHCIDSAFPATENGDWTQFEIEVSPSGRITHLVNGTVTMSYEGAQYDPQAPEAVALIAAAGGDLALKGGYIALQSEGHPVEFRNIEVLELR